MYYSKHLEPNILEEGPFVMHKKRQRQCDPVICPPQVIVRDCFIPRMVPHIHPIVHVNRYNIVNVPQHIYTPIVRNEVYDPGCPTDGKHKKKRKH